MKKQIAIIGGGAAGLAAAVSAARMISSSNDKAEVVLFETADRMGKSILASGNGRCNFSNSDISPDVYHNEEFVTKSMEVLPSAEVFDFFRELGLLWQEESEGCLYPLTNKASAVLDVLRFASQERGVEIRCGQEVHALTPANGRFLVSLADGTAMFFDAVVVACGGKVARALLPAGYRYHNTEPMLGPLKTKTDAIRGLNNIRVHCAVRHGTFREEGEVLFRNYGISGIVSFNLSRFAKAGDVISLDFLPHLSFEQTEALLRGRFSQLGRRSALEFCAGMLLPPLARAVLKASGIKAEVPISESDLPSLACMMKGFPLKVEGIEDYRQCQIQRGGFAVDSFAAQTMESRSDPGLFVVGEALDVDGPCGGFNLHWAWTSGILAGRAAVNAVSWEML